MNGIITMIQNLVTVVKSWALNVEKLFFSDDPEEVTMKMLDENTNEPVDKPVKNLAMIKSEFEEWKTEFLQSFEQWKTKILAHCRPLYLYNAESAGVKTQSGEGVWVKHYTVSNAADITDSWSTSCVSGESIDVSATGYSVEGYKPLCVYPNLYANPAFFKKGSMIKGKIFFNNGEITEFELCPNASNRKLIARSTVGYNSHGEDAPLLHHIIVQATANSFRVWFKPMTCSNCDFAGEVVFDNEEA